MLSLGTNAEVPGRMQTSKKHMITPEITVIMNIEAIQVRKQAKFDSPLEPKLNDVTK